MQESTTTKKGCAMAARPSAGFRQCMPLLMQVVRQGRQRRAQPTFGTLPGSAAPAAATGVCINA